TFFDGYLYHPYPPETGGIGTDTLAESLYALGKVGWYDTDARDNVDWVSTPRVLRNVAWPQVLSGVYFREYVASTLQNDGASNVAIEFPGELDTLSYVHKFFRDRAIPFAAMSPQDSLGTNGVDVLAGSGKYVAYSQGSNFTLFVPNGSYTGEWYDPRSGS